MECMTFGYKKKKVEERLFASKLQVYNVINSKKKARRAGVAVFKLIHVTSCDKLV